MNCPRNGFFLKKPLLFLQIDLDEFIDCPAESRFAEGGFSASVSGSSYPPSANDDFLHQQPVHNAEDERIYEITKQINAYSTPQATPQYARMILQVIFVFDTIRENTNQDQICLLFKAFVPNNVNEDSIIMKNFRNFKI